MGVVVAQVMEFDGNGPAVLILEIAVLVSWAAESPRKMAVVSRSQPELWWQFFYRKGGSWFSGLVVFSPPLLLGAPCRPGFIKVLDPRSDYDEMLGEPARWIRALVGVESGRAVVVAALQIVAMLKGSCC